MQATWKHPQILIPFSAGNQQHVNGNSYVSDVLYVRVQLCIVCVLAFISAHMHTYDHCVYYNRTSTYVDTRATSPWLGWLAADAEDLRCQTCGGLFLFPLLMMRLKCSFFADFYLNTSLTSVCLKRQQRMASGSIRCTRWLSKRKN